MAKSDYQSALANWHKRAGQARAAGVPDSVWKPLAKRDLTSISALGRSPMADKEVQDAMRAAVGQSPITDPHKRSESVFDIIGNIPSDIQTIVTGFPAGFAGFVHDIPEASHDLYSTFFEPQKRPAIAAKYGITPNRDIGDVLRNLPRTPLLGPLLPGAATAAAATTPQGRESLKEHPVATTIDVGAALATAGKLGAFGKGAAVRAAEGAALEDAITETPARTFHRPGGAFATAADVEKLLAFQKDRYSPLAALQAGKPYKALGRTAMDLTERAPGLGNVVNRSSTRNVLMTLGFHPDLVERLARPFAEIRDRNLAKMNRLLRSDVIAPILKLPEEDRTLLARVTRGVESDADRTLFDARPDLQAIHDTTRRTMDYFAEKNPNVATVDVPWGKKYHYTASSPVAKRFRAMNKHQALFEKSLAELDRVTVIRRKLEQSLGPHDPKTVQARIREKIASDNFTERVKLRDEAKTKFTEVLHAHAPASFYSLLADKARGRAVGLAKWQSEQGTLLHQLPEVMRRIEDAIDTKDLQLAVGAKEGARIMRETEATWTALAQNGVDPIFLPNTPAARVEHVAYPTVIPDSAAAKAHVSKNTAFNLSRTVNDVAVGITEYQRQLLTESGTREFAERWVKPWAKDVNAVRRDIGRAIDNGGAMAPEVRRRLVETEMRRHWENWNTETNKFSSYFPTPAGETHMLPKGVTRAIKQLGLEEAKSGPFRVAYDKGMKVWRFAVLTTPRHMSHVLLGGAMMGILRDPFFVPHFIQRFSEVRRIIRLEDDVLIAKFGKHINFDPDQLFAIGSGKSHGRMYNTATGPVKYAIDKANKLEEQATLMYKITTMLTKEAKGVQREEAIRMANKMFVDMNAMTPFERNSIRMIFPFYGFTRHLFRYLMTYPADHPVTASILTNFALQHEKDWDSGLPRDMKFLFFLGHPDVNGKVTGIDYRSIDPFRSFYNIFTIGGFAASMNPAFQFGATQMGTNVLSGTPELFPKDHFDPNTGMMVADQPPNLGLRLAEAAVPEVVGVDALFALSDQFRNLKITDPEAYKKRVYTAFGLPFAPIPVNKPEKIETTQMKRYADASASVGEAIRTGDFSKAKRYDAVPTPSLLRAYLGNRDYATPAEIERVYNILRQQADAAGISGSLHGHLPKPRQRTGH